MDTKRSPTLSSKLDLFFDVVVKLTLTHFITPPSTPYSPPNLFGFGGVLHISYITAALEHPFHLSSPPLLNFVAPLIFGGGKFHKFHLRVKFQIKSWKVSLGGQVSLNKGQVSNQIPWIKVAQSKDSLRGQDVLKTWCDTVCPDFSWTKKFWVYSSLLPFMGYWYIELIFSFRLCNLFVSLSHLKLKEIFLEQRAVCQNQN